MVYFSKTILLSFLLPLFIIFPQWHLYWFPKGFGLQNIRSSTSFLSYYPLRLLFSMGSADRKSHFRVLQKFNTEYSPTAFSQYVSERTGMNVVVVDQKGPKVSGYFTLATEIHDDSGAPHTLEHLCFMGSKSYRYKGFLDKLATRAYSNTNAWTATDHTAYTLDTAGWEGFAQILPVYLEHVILPTLTEAGCYTEVHHIDGSGNDAGVVYSEMQGVQNNQDELMDLKVKRIIYPEGVGFRYETGGMMEALRALSVQRIRDFHREMYQPKNLCLILAGQIDHENLLEILDDFESTILDDIPRPDSPFTRPWIDSKQAPPIEKSTIERVEFPEEDESFGQVEIRFLGPNCVDSELSAALQVSLLYLCGSSVSVLENALVEKEQLCSAVYYNSEDRPKTEISFTLTSVATEKLAQVEARFFEVLRAHMDDKLDMAYMVDCIRRNVRTWKFATERSATSFTQFAITDFLYGKRDGSTLKDVASLREYEHLETWTEAQWRDFIKKWISEAKHVSILGVPSAELSKKLKADEEARVAEQRKRLGEEGLKDLEDKLEKAKAENDKEIPKKLLADFKVPGVDSIHFFDTITARSGSALKAGHPNNRIQKIIDSDHSAQPPFLHFEHISSNFVRISLLIATQSIPIELRPLLSIYLEAFFKLPVNRNGKHVEFEQIVMELERDTVGFSIDCGYSAGNSEEMCISFAVEPDKYETAVKSIQELLSKTVFTQERLAAITTQLLSDVPESKRSGNGMLQSISTMTHYAPGAVNRAGDTLVKALYLKRIKKLLGTDPDAVISQLERIRKSLIAFENFRVLIVGDIEKLPKPVSTWPILTNGLDTSKDLKPIVQRLEVLSEAGKDPGNLTYIIPMATIDSSFALSVAKGPSSYDDPKLPALMVATEYLNSVEGPLWVAVRGTGLAYGANVGSSIPSGWVRFSIYRSPNAYRAFEISKKLVEDFVSGQTPLDDLALEGAISGIVVGFADEQYTMSAAAQLSFVRQVYRQLPEDWNEKMLKMVREVGFEEIKDAMKTFILPLFTPEKANIFVTCATVMEESIKTGFESSGFSPKIKTLADFQDDYGLQADGDEQDDQDENDEDDNEESDADDADEAGTALRGLK